MKRSLLSVIVFALLVLTLSLNGCSGTSRHWATFDKYEATTETTTDSEGAAVYKVLRTGNAFVTLEDGTRVRADCPIQDVAQGKPVTVQQNPDGSWAVMEVLPED